MDKLREIIDHKRIEIEGTVARADKLRAAALARNEFRSLYDALSGHGQGLGMIAEVKKASPSAGDIALEIDPVEQAVKYAAAGASAVSVLTDEKYFKGSLQFMTQVANAVDIPVLRKDFIIHEAQIFEAVVAGADAILLIVAALTQEELVHLLDVAHTYQLDVLVEVHNEEELERALETDARIIGVNNRDLKTFTVSLETTKRLSELMDSSVLLVSESGIKTRKDCEDVHSWGADAVLVGETLMRAGDVGTTMADLMLADRVDSSAAE